jgi:hypothetical protein
MDRKAMTLTRTAAQILHAADAPALAASIKLVSALNVQHHHFKNSNDTNEEDSFVVGVENP